jgi:hypothetical protein
MLTDGPPAPKGRNRFQGLPRFSPNLNNYNNLGNLLFALQSTQDASTDGVLTQYWHSDPETEQRINRLPVSDAMMAVIKSGALDKLNKKFDEISASRMGWYGNEKAAQDLFY